MNLLQDMAVENADQLGFGFEACRAQGLAWVGASYMLQILRFPKMHERFSIETWPSEARKWGAVREFIVRDSAGDKIIKARSLWVLVDYERKRPVSLQKHFPNYVMLDEQAIAQDFPCLPAVENVQNECRMMVRFDDIDVNQHVNNAVYLLWASECVDAAFRKQHAPVEIDIQFKKEALYGENVVILSSLDGCESWHSIREAESQTELALCRIKWRDVTSE